CRPLLSVQLCNQTPYHRCQSEYPIERCALFEQAKAPMAHIQHLGSCLLDCGAQPRFWPGPAALRVLTVQLGCGRAAKAPARLAHSKTALASTACGPEPNSFVHKQRSEESDRETLRFAQGDRPAGPIFRGLI